MIPVILLLVRAYPGSLRPSKKNVVFPVTWSKKTRVGRSGKVFFLKKVFEHLSDECLTYNFDLNSLVNCDGRQAVCSRQAALGIRAH